ncbi:MAG: GNAT family N-acetyltransferase [Cellulosilyticaceae bacterium]
MKSQIRAFEMRDVEAIWKLNTMEMGYEFSIEASENKLRILANSSKEKIYVAVVDDKVVGYVHANDYDVIYAPHMKNIMGIAVSEDYKRQGIGKALLFAVEEWAKETGASGVRLVSGETRIGAHRFYQSCGYEGGKRQANFKKIF